MGLYGPVTASDLDRVEEFYGLRGVACEIVVSPLADPSLRDSFAPRGYRITEFNSVLIRPLEGCVLVPPADGITVERVTADTQPTWDRVIARGFAQYGPLPQNLFAAFATLPDSLSFLARVDGEPAGGGMGAIMKNANIRSAIRYGDGSGVPRTRPADGTDQPSIVGGGPAGLRVRGGEHDARQRFAAEHGAKRLSPGV